MLGWSIVLVVLAIIFIVTLVVSRIIDRYYLDKWYDIVNLISGILLFIPMIATVFVPLTVKQEINAFENYQTMVNETYTDGTIEDTAINLKVIELNQWLADARASEETYGIFSFYRNKLDDLDYITLDKENE